MGVIAGGNHVCKMCPGALVGMLGVLIFDKRAFAFEMCVFGAFFLNQVGFAGLKVGGMNELERTHVVWITYYTNLIQLVQFFYEFLSFNCFKFVKMWVSDAGPPWTPSLYNNILHTIYKIVKYLARSCENKVYACFITKK